MIGCLAVWLAVCLSDCIAACLGASLAVWSAAGGKLADGLVVWLPRCFDGWFIWQLGRTVVNGVAGWFDLW